MNISGLRAIDVTVSPKVVGAELAVSFEFGGVIVTYKFDISREVLRKLYTVSHSVWNGHEIL